MFVKVAGVFKWMPKPGAAYRTKNALDYIILEKRRKRLPVFMREERNVFGMESVRREVKTTKISNKRTNTKKVILRPNVAKKKINSEVLEFEMKVLMSMSAMRSIEDAGSFDEYILNTSEKDLRCAFPINLKRKMLKKMKVLKLIERNANLPKEGISKEGVSERDCKVGIVNGNDK